MEDLRSLFAFDNIFRNDWNRDVVVHLLEITWNCAKTDILS